MVGNVFNGSYTSYYENGNISEQGTFLNGVPNGIWKSYYKNGNQKAKIQYIYDNIVDHTIKRKNTVNDKPAKRQREN
uniref:MORN repeat protein n=1 Tax=viral metagenome TaxID=1070528 RepID=A0A6C0EBI2_9ZZZZ